MYNSKQIEPFIEKIRKEAEEAANKVIEKYEPELIRRIRNQLGKGETFVSGMGVGFVLDKMGEIKYSVNDDFVDCITDVQYNDFIQTAIGLPDITKD